MENSSGVVTFQSTDLLLRSVFQKRKRKNRPPVITAVHNHWLFEEPRLMYMHWENVGDPFEFARKSAEAAREVGLF
jgi:hypothetical protein